MLEQLFLHLVQYADELRNSSRASIECGVFKNLQHYQVSNTNEPSLTMEYLMPSPIDFSTLPLALPLCGSVEPRAFEELCPVESLRHPCIFSFQHPPPNPSASPSILPDMVTLAFEGECAVSTAASPVPEVPGNSDPFRLPMLTNSAICSAGGPHEACSYAKSPFDPFSDSIYYEPFPPKNKLPAPAPLTGLAEAKRQGNGSWQVIGAKTPHQKGVAGLSSAIPSLAGESVPRPTNVFVANFPAHWSKSDLWDLFEGIPVTTVHVLPEKRGKGEEPASGGTGFVNVTRAGDAQALLSMLDKKVWLIEGSALKFRLANSSAPSDPMTFHEHKNLRTTRRHQHKVIDRLRAEQTIGNRQVGACDRHQIVVYKNNPSSGQGSSTLSVVHGSRQHNSYLVCNSAESQSFRGPHHPHRPLLEFLRSQLSRWNHYNSHHTTPARCGTVVPTLFSAGFSPVAASAVSGPSDMVVGRHSTLPTVTLRSMAPLPTPFRLPPVPTTRRLLKEQRPPYTQHDTLVHPISPGPQGTYYIWPSGMECNLEAYHPQGGHPYALSAMALTEYGLMPSFKDAAPFLGYQLG